MARTLTLEQAQEELKRLAEAPAADAHEQVVAVTGSGKTEPLLAILPWELYESLIETIEVLQDQELMAAIREGLEAIERGETIPWEQVKAEPGL